MKKIKMVGLIILVILFAVLGMLLANKIIDKETKYSKKLTFSSEEQMLAVFFVGGMENSYDYSNINKYFANEEINNFETVELGGEECYLIVPRYNMKIVLSSLSMAEDGGTVSKKIKEVSKPFFLKCNISDIFPNSELNFEYDGVKYKYSPYISLKDGSVVVEDFVMLGN